MTGSKAERFLAVADLDDSLALRSAAEGAEPPTIQTIPKPDELSWWDWAVFLLQTTAEIEHVLMVQYLYAAYSLADSSFAGKQVPIDAAKTTQQWRNTITAIAREEMAHLLTEQNLLRFIGGPPNFDREDFPFRSMLYPFPFTLEALSKTSLAKYVSAEMPANPAEPNIEEIVARATSAAGGVRPNRVGVLFDTLIDIFADPSKLTDADLRPLTAVDRQAAPSDWLGFGGLVVRAVSTRAEAVAALKAVGEQGEGPDEPPPGEPSHFHRFLTIYREFPETESGAEPDWVPTKSIPANPTTSPAAATDPVLEQNRITHPVSRLWAQLFNVRYRMVLVDLAHALQLSGPLTDDQGNPTVRGSLRDWAFIQMRGQIASGMKGLAGTLTSRPAKENPAPGDPVYAAAPFELPYTLAIPDEEHSRWRLHLALLDASAGLVTRLRTAGETGALLDELDSVDAEARALVTGQLAIT
jgi:hypothetical protein